MKSLLGYYGGKAGPVGAWIANQLPPHRLYVEPFGGMGGVLMQKGYSPVEVYNDRDDLLVNLFRVIRCAEQRAHLEQQLALTPYSRTEFRECVASLQEEASAVEKARRTYTVLAQSFHNALIAKSWSFGGASYGNSVAEKFVNGQVRIAAVAERLRRVQIEHADWQDVCRQWDGKETLFYVDPPYVWGTRSGKGYAHELDDAAHLELVRWCLQASGKVLLSGYACDLYQQLEAAGWERREMPTVAHSSAARQKKNGAASRTECLWVSPNSQRKTLFCP